MEQRPEIEFAQTYFNLNYPQYEMDINMAREEESVVDVSRILSTLQGYIGGIYAADFTKFGKQFRVIVLSLQKTRMDESLPD